MHDCSLKPLVWWRFIDIFLLQHLEEEILKELLNLGIKNWLIYSEIRFFCFEFRRLYRRWISQNIQLGFFRYFSVPKNKPSFIY